MSDHTIHALQGLGLKQRVRALSNASVRLSTLQSRLQAEHVAKQLEVTALSDKVELLTKVGELFRVLMDLMVVDQVHSVEEVVTEGIRSIFHDLDLWFEAEVGQKYGRVSIDFMFRQGAKDNPLAIRGEPLSSFGGGPASVASFILRVLAGLRLKLWPLFILDEALAAVSEAYVTGTSQFLKGLASKLGVDILLVTHNQGFLEHADQAYRCIEGVSDDGTPCLALRNVK
jgi:hypothetical protein